MATYEWYYDTQHYKNLWYKDLREKDIYNLWGLIKREPVKRRIKAIIYINPNLKEKV